MLNAPPNTLMVLTNPDAAQGVLRPPCLLSEFAAHQHVVPVRNPPRLVRHAERR